MQHQNTTSLSVAEDNQNIADIEFAIQAQHQAHIEVEEAGGMAMITLPAKQVISMVECFLSAMETFGGYNVVAMEVMMEKLALGMFEPLQTQGQQVAH